jgi:carbon storage regulator
MLVLSRKSGESIRIGPDVVITVLAVQGNKVRLGISAPTGISIWRDELVLDSAALPIRHASLLSESQQAAIC